MNRSEPANPNLQEDRKTENKTEASPLAAELAGYCDLGMRRQALRLTRATLKKRQILPEEFSEVTRCVGVYADFKSWKPSIEAAYNRQTLKFKRQVRPEMLALYAETDDWNAARPFVSVHRPSSLSDILFGMEVLLKLDELQAAQPLATRCKRLLRFATDRFHQSILLTALGHFFSRMHRWDEALTVWELMPLEQPFRRNALSGIVELHLARAVEAVRQGLQFLSQLKEHPNTENDLCLPGNDLGMTREAEKELLRFQRGVDKLLPRESRKDLGMGVTADAN
jgi:hypothetical protein